MMLCWWQQSSESQIGSDAAQDELNTAVPFRVNLKQHSQSGESKWSAASRYYETGRMEGAQVSVSNTLFGRSIVNFFCLLVLLVGFLLLLVVVVLYVYKYYNYCLLGN